jgi:penicillin-binding protein A
MPLRDPLIAARPARPAPAPSFGPRRVKRRRRFVLLGGLALAVLLGFAAAARQQTPEEQGDAQPEPAADAGTAPKAELTDEQIEKAMGEFDPAEAKDAKEGEGAKAGSAAAKAESDKDAKAAEAARPEDAKELEGTAELHQVPATTANAAARIAPLPGLSLLKKARVGAAGFFIATTPDGKTARLTLHAELQAQMQKLLSTYRPEGAALVAVEPKTGKVLALVEYAADGRAQGMATRPLYPAASVFKIITGAALLEKGVSPDTETCYHGGMHGLVGKLLQDKPRLDRRCLSLSMALAKSANVVFAKMAVKHLDARALREQAEKFLFNRTLWSDPAVESSTAQIPEGGLDFAKSAAGFGDVKLSPLHAALIAGAVGNGGVAQGPTLIESVDGAEPSPASSRRLLRPETAKKLTEMMKLTVSQGTATHSFRERRRMVLGDIEVAGKTGSLSSHKKPFKDYSWFVGFAPADDPQIAVAAVVVNGIRWKIHAPYVAREALRAYLVGGKLGQPPAARVKHKKRIARRR